MNLEKMFEKHGDEFLKFNKVENKFCDRPDLNAFLILNNLIPDIRDIVSSAEHDEIWLSVDCEKLSEIISEEEVITLIRCGIRYKDDCLCMFV